MSIYLNTAHAKVSGFLTFFNQKKSSLIIRLFCNLTVDWLAQHQMANILSEKIVKSRTEEGKTATGHFWHSTSPIICKNKKWHNLIHINYWYLIKKMKKKAVLLSLINYQCLKQAKKWRGEGEGQGRGEGGGVPIHNQRTKLLHS